MSVVTERLRSDILFFLDSTKRAVDAAQYQTLRSDSAQSSNLIEASLGIERTRLVFRQQTSSRRFRRSSWVDIKRSLSQNIREVLSNETIRDALFKVRMRPITAGSLSRRVEGSDILPVVFESGLSVAEAMDRFEGMISGIEILPASDDNADSLAVLADIVPTQQLAPAQFEILNNKIRLSERRPKTRPEDNKTLAAALAHIKEAGETLLNNLKQSNCDPRIAESVEYLNEQVNTNDNVIRIGLANIACSILGNNFREELPDAVSGMLTAHVSSISLYISQFPEWEEFTQRAAEIEFDETDYEQVRETTEELEKVLEEDADLAEPEVPKTIALVREFLKNPGKSGRRAFFAAVRTIENLVAAILRYSLRVIGKTAEDTIEGIAKVASKVIIGMLGVALLGASGIGPAAVHAGVPWVQQAADIVQKQIEVLTKSD